MGKLYSTSLISLPIIRQSSRSKVFNQSRTGSTPLAERKNLAGSLFNLPPLNCILYGTSRCVIWISYSIKNKIFCTLIDVKKLSELKKLPDERVEVKDLLILREFQQILIFTFLSSYRIKKVQKAVHRELELSYRLWQRMASEYLARYRK